MLILSTQKKVTEVFTSGTGCPSVILLKVRKEGLQIAENYRLVVQNKMKPLMIIIPELQAFALDWITSNLYVVFHNHHRILVCSSKYTDTVRNMTDNNGCAELFWNQVASSVGGLALDPNQGYVLSYVQRFTV